MWSFFFYTQLQSVWSLPFTSVMSLHGITRGIGHQFQIMLILWIAYNPASIEDGPKRFVCNRSGLNVVGVSPD